MSNSIRNSVLVVDDEEAVGLYLKEILKAKFDVVTAKNAAEAFELLSSHPIDIILLDLILADGDDGLSVLKKIRERRDDIDVVIVSGIKEIKTVTEAIRQGAKDYVAKPIDKDDLFLALARVTTRRDLEKQNQVLRDKLLPLEGDDQIIGSSREILEIKAMIQRLKGHDVNVLLVGDTGTGKEVFARRLHAQENDHKRPFVSVNCAAIPSNLLESVLFGHEKGAFTGATETRIGKFELASGGDIFLDEVSSLGLELQAKLLRVLEEKEVERVGGKAARKVSFRVISACNDDILKRVAEGSFRSDLFYRLNTVSVQLPSLNDRAEDILPLAEHFLRKYKRTPEPKALSPEVREFLLSHIWRGNVRELRNTIENMLIFSKGPILTAADIAYLKNGVGHHAASPTVSAPPLSGAQQAGPPQYAGGETGSAYVEKVRAFEKEIFLKTLERNRWSKTKTCIEMGISRNKLYRKLEELGIPQ